MGEKLEKSCGPLLSFLINIKQLHNIRQLFNIVGNGKEKKCICAPPQCWMDPVATVQQLGCFLTDTTIRDCYTCLNLASVTDYQQREPLRRGQSLLHGVR